jgi:hypothetical protein
MILKRETFVILQGRCGRFGGLEGVAATTTKEPSTAQGATVSLLAKTSSRGLALAAA